MGLFDQIGSLAAGQLHSALGQTRFGGLDGLLQHLSQSVSAHQVGQALGGGELEKIAASLGVQPQVATELLARLLPQATSKSQE
jgi:hypothetical protein